MAESKMIETGALAGEAKGVVWVMESGAFKAKSYDLFIMPEEIIPAKLCTHHSPVYPSFRQKGTGRAIVFGAVVGRASGATIAGIAAKNREKTIEKAIEVAKLPKDELLGMNEDNFAISKSDILKISLTHKGILQKIMLPELETKQRKYRWEVIGILGNEDGAFEDVERILRSAVPAVQVKN
jgi:hypothetical protein